jgi:type VI secretion system protein ImpK
MATSSRKAAADERRRGSVDPRARPGPRLLWPADAVLAVIPQLRAAGFIRDLARLRDELAAMLRDFQARARRDGIEPTRIAHATEVLAAVIDQAVMSMPWGADAGWQSLARASVSTGALSAPPSPARRLIDAAHRSFSDAGMRELIDVALALGFDGATSPAEEVPINQLRAELAGHASPYAERFAYELSPAGESSVERGNGGRWLPLWVSGALVAAALAVLFLALELSLAAKSDRLYARIAGFDGAARQAARPLPAPQPRLAGALTAESAAANVSVRDEIDRSVAIVPAAQLFAPGDATLLQGGAALLRPIAAALERAPGRIRVIGYTAGDAVRSARYPSDWDLSVDRARAVEDALTGLGVESSRMSYDGRGSVEPLAADDERPSFADGRVEIVLLAGR